MVMQDDIVLASYQMLAQVLGVALCTLGLSDTKIPVTELMPKN